jgi:hypothetical protein
LNLFLNKGLIFVSKQVDFSKTLDKKGEFYVWILILISYQTPYLYEFEVQTKDLFNLGLNIHVGMEFVIELNTYST